MGKTGYEIETLAGGDLGDESLLEAIAKLFGVWYVGKAGKVIGTVAGGDLGDDSEPLEEIDKELDRVLEKGGKAGNEM